MGEIDKIKLGGGRKKNGHKISCTCHICENMRKKAHRGGYTEEYEKEQEKISGGTNKKNGHRKNCNCPICKNMRHKQKGGNFLENDETRKEEDDIVANKYMAREGGGKPKGHKKNCQCPICKRMRKMKKGGDEPDIENQLGDIEEGLVKASNKNTDEDNIEIPASDSEYDALDEAEKGNAGINVVGGTRRKRRNYRKKTYKKKRSSRKRSSRKRFSRKRFSRKHK